MQCVVLAGGLGTRLWPLTQTVPKSLIPINGRPFASYQLNWLSRQGITDVVYCIGYLGAQIKAALGDGSRFGLTIEYVDEGEDLRGTGGALRGALDAGLLAEVFFVLYGDSFLPVQFAPILAAFKASGCRALMTVMRNENRWDKSNAVFAAPWVTVYDKKPDEATRKRMNYIDYGLSILCRDLIAQEIPPGDKVDLADLFKQMSLAGSLAGLEITERFYEVGSQSGIEEFSRFVERSAL